MKKQALAWILAAGILLTGCAQSGVGESAAAPSAQPVDSGQEAQSPADSQAGSHADTPAPGGTLSISWWGTEFVHEYTLELVAKFEEKSGYKVEPTYAGWANYWKKLNTLAAAGDLPDCMRQDYSVIAQYVAKNLLEPLEPYIESGAIDTANVEERLISGGRMATTSTASTWAPTPWPSSTTRS